MGNVHGNSIGIESTSGRIVLETAEEIVVADGVEFGIALEAVNSTLALYSISALNIIVIGEEYFLGSMELTAAADGLFRPVVPANVNLDVGPTAVGLDPLDPGDVRGLRGLRRPHEDAVPD